MSKYEESLSIRRALADESGTAESRCDVSDSLENVARIEEAQGAFDCALAKYEESLEIHRLLLDPEQAHETVLDAADSVNVFVWTSCLVARCALRLGRPSFALDRLVASEGFLAPLAHPELVDEDLLDTAATWHEQRSAVALAQGDPATARRHENIASAIRTRIQRLQDEEDGDAS